MRDMHLVVEGFSQYRRPAALGPEISVFRVRCYEYAARFYVVSSLYMVIRGLQAIYKILFYKSCHMWRAARVQPALIAHSRTTPFHFAWTSSTRVASAPLPQHT